ncbi:hypothetical protein TNCV_4894431 [Trichonephila clavipes]|nr:hypothetical protein TNCV_4894431 [Trichonephila clavipes]
MERNSKYGTKLEARLQQIWNETRGKVTANMERNVSRHHAEPLRVLAYLYREGIQGSSDGLSALYKLSPAWYDLCARVKSFFTCPCSLSLSASSAHLLNCRGISLGQLFGNQDLACNILMCKGQEDLV